VKRKREATISSTPKADLDDDRQLTVIVLN
jgi:hypothetical protein